MQLVDNGQDPSKSYAKHLIDHVIDSAGNARMRDLPAYFLCSTSLQKSIKKYLHLHHQQSFALEPKLVDRLLSPDFSGLSGHVASILDSGAPATLRT